MSDRIVVSRQIDLHQGGSHNNTAAPVVTIVGKNKSGGSVALGDVVIWDTTNSTPDLVAFKTTTSGNDPLVMGMAYETIASNAFGKIQVWGPTDALKVDGTTDIAVGDFIGTYTTAKIGQKTTGQGAFAIAQEAYTTNDSLGVIDAFINCWALTNNNSVSGLTWGSVWSNAVHTHASNAQGGTLTISSAAVANTVTTATLTSTLGTGFVPLPINDFRLISANDIPNSGAGDGGLLSKDTAPKLERVNGATDKQLRIAWAATGVVGVTTQFAYPPDLDDTAALTVNMLAVMAGATDTPQITVAYFENVGDTDAGGTTAALSNVLAKKSRTIAAADVGPYPAVATVELVPGAHGTDALYVYAVWIEYTRK